MSLSLQHLTKLYQIGEKMKNLEVQRLNHFKKGRLFFSCGTFVSAVFRGPGIYGLDHISEVTRTLFI